MTKHIAELQTLHDINTEIPEGKLLLAALSVLMDIRTTETPDEVLAEVVAKTHRMFPPAPPIYNDLTVADVDKVGLGGSGHSGRNPRLVRGIP